MAKLVPQKVREQIICDYRQSLAPCQTALARKYQVTTATIQRILKPVIYERFLELKSCGCSLDDIADRLGIHLNTCQKFDQQDINNVVTEKVATLRNQVTVGRFLEVAEGIRQKSCQGVDWYCLRDILDCLDNPSTVTYAVQSINYHLTGEHVKKFLVVDHLGRRNSAYFISREGMQIVLQRSYKHALKVIHRYFN